jgi:hypothetical protein
MRSLVKKITPKTDKAREFVKEHGDTFVIEDIGAFGISIRSTKTQDVIGIEVEPNGDAYLNGVLVDWAD